ASARIARPFVALGRAGRRGDLGARAETFVHIRAKSTQSVLIEQRTLGLKYRLAIPVKPQPAQFFQLLPGHSRPHAGPVDVLDTHDVSAMYGARPQPGEQRGARVAQM